MNEFASYLKSVRSKNNLTQTQFAAKLDLDTAALSKIENGKKSFDPSKLDMLATEFDLNIDELKSIFFGEKIANELVLYGCPISTLQIAKKKYKHLVQN